MGAERDYLVRFVFPRLREIHASRRVRIVDVDLRWGITEEMFRTATGLSVILEEIDHSRPFVTIQLIPTG